MTVLCITTKGLIHVRYYDKKLLLEMMNWIEEYKLKFSNWCKCADRIVAITPRCKRGGFGLRGCESLSAHKWKPRKRFFHLWLEQANCIFVIKNRNRPQGFCPCTGDRVGWSSHQSSALQSGSSLLSQPSTLLLVLLFFLGGNGGLRGISTFLSSARFSFCWEDTVRSFLRYI